MKKIDLKYIATTIANLANIPIRIYENNEQIFYYATMNLTVDPIILNISEILKIEDHISYYITHDFFYYGIINYDKFKIILGPSFNNISDETIKNLAFNCNLDNDSYNDFYKAIKAIMPMPLNSIMQILCTINYILNDEKLTLEDIIIYDSEQKEYEKEINKIELKNNLNTNITNIHNTIDLENMILNYVRNGDLDSLKQWLQKAPAIRGGILANEQIRQLKNTFVVTITLVSRSAINGGLDIDEALSLSDSYIQKCELLNSIERITNLQYHMLLDYTKRVYDLKINKINSKLVLSITNYIKHHITEPINITKLAKDLFISRTYLATKFKNETNMTLSNYYLKMKIDEAKNLLIYTDKSLNQISSYLGFSSQSHFTNTFKKYTNKSPNEFRKERE